MFSELLCIGTSIDSFLLQNTLSLLSCWKTQLQVIMSNLDIFTYVPLQTKSFSKFLSSLPDLIRIHMTAIKHKKSQIIYNYQVTIKQIFICKVMVFFRKVFLFVFLATMLIHFFTSLNSAGEQFRIKTALLKKNLF